jgi:hypothetical protein
MSNNLHEPHEPQKATTFLYCWKCAAIENTNIIKGYTFLWFIWFITLYDITQYIITHYINTVVLYNREVA